MTARPRYVLAALLASASPAAAAPSDRAQRCVADSDRGQEERDRGAFLAARASFRACSIDECPALVRKDCAQWLADVEVNLPSVVLGARDARGNDVLGVRISVDGEPQKDAVDTGRAVPLDPGPHLFRFEHPPDAPIELQAVLHTGERNRPIFATFAPVTLPLPPPAPSGVDRAARSADAPSAPERRTAGVDRAAHGADAPSRAEHVSGWAYVLGAASVVGLGSFAYFGATGLDEKSRLRGSCGNVCSDADVAPLKGRYIAADVSLGLGVVAAGIAAWLFLHPRAERAAAPATAVSIAPGARGASVWLTRTF